MTAARCPECEAVTVKDHVGGEVWGEPRYMPVGSIQRVLAEWFGIDEDALEREKRAMLAAIRSAA
jgi:hypothetical protein